MRAQYTAERFSFRAEQLEPRNSAQIEFRFF